MIDYKNKLNPEQYKGVTTTEGPVLVLAGAGSGKTRLLTHKISYLIEHIGIDPSSIMAVTFTNKAANEMKERVRNLINMDISSLWIGTFHSLSGRILRREAESVGLNSSFSIYDADDSIRLVKSILDDLGYDKKEFPPKSIIEPISRLKEELIMPDEFKGMINSDRDKLIYNVYSEYQKELKKNNAVDFDDMIVHVVNLFAGNLEKRKKWSNRFNYILVDEFQDTNQSQFDLISYLSETHKNLTVVGDDDQSIYSWRGALIRNIIDFPKFFKGSTIIRLEQNYRSTQHILSCASKLVANNLDRHEKTLWTNQGDGKQVCLHEFHTDYDEVNGVLREIKKLIDNGADSNEIAILYRANSISRIFEDKLRSLKIPYEIIGGQKFYERAEIKDLLAYLRILVNTNDNLSFARVCNMPRRGIGTKSFETLKIAATDKNLSLYQTAKEHLDDIALSNKANIGFKEFINVIDSIREKIDSLTLPEILEALLEQSGYAQMYAEDDSEESQGRLENLGEFMNIAVEFAKNNNNPTLVNFLEESALTSDIDSWNPEDKTISLMTIHSAKGLEFEHIFIVAAEDGIFPVIMEGDETNLEEERRLMYVAITRGKKNVHISYTSERSRFGKINEQIPSRFIKELPDEHINKGEKDKKPATPKYDASPQRIPPLFDMKTRVKHPFFGTGIVIKVRGNGDSAIITVNFKDHGVKKLVAGFSKLERC